MRRNLLARSASSMTSQLGTHYEGAILLFTSGCKTSEMEGEAEFKNRRKSWHTALCCRRPNKASCKNHSSTPGISMHTFPKEAKLKQKWITFTRIHMHRLACQWNTLPCAPSILKHRVSAEVCLLGHQWISRGFTLRKVQYHQYRRSRKIHWTLITQEMREDLQIDFFPKKRSLDVSLGPHRETSVSKIPPPPKKKN